jgi:hypothetical protein
MKRKCDWPGCLEESEQPMINGWANYAYAEDTLPGLPAAGYLCPIHKLAFEGLAVGEQPPTDSEH